MSLSKFSVAAAVLLATSMLAGCSNSGSGSDWASKSEVNLAAGPAIRDVSTSFDEALTCLRGRIRPEVIFGVGQVSDSTGKESYAEGGTGKFVTQGAGEIVQSALFKAGVSVVNRRDAGIAVTEANWGIRDIKSQVPVHFYVSGSINGLDFIPGRGASGSVMGIGIRARQNRILIALDLSMTDAFTGKVVASVPLQKQIVADELGALGDQFFGDTLISLEIGGMQREALHFALRQMLSLATLELLGQLMDSGVYEPCRILTGLESGGAVMQGGTSDPSAVSDVQKRAFAMGAPPLAVPVVDQRNAVAPQEVAPAVAVAGPQTQSQQAQKSDGMSREQAMRELVSIIQSNAVLAIREADASRAAASRDEAIRRATNAVTQANRSLAILRQAAKAGLEGERGDAAAIVVEQAMTKARLAATDAAGRPTDAPSPSAIDEQPQAESTETTTNPGVVIPGSPESIRRSGR
jgi:curli biogenesis system outer membrane secretion channel CsgG